jgi:hypothetical protein
MSGPTQTAYVRTLQEEATRRRLELAKLLRADPTITNLALAKALNVSRNTITIDRKALMEQLKQSTLTETEQLRSAMVSKLESLNEELELHRKDGKLPTGVVHEMLLVHRTIIEMLGIRKAVVEQLEVRKKTVAFNTTVVRTQMVDGKPVVVSENKGLCGVTTNHLALKAGDDEAR